MNRMLLWMPLGLPVCFIGGVLSVTSYQTTAALLVVGGMAWPIVCLIAGEMAEGE